MSYQDRKEYYKEANERLRIGRRIAKELEAIRSQRLVGSMLGISRALVEKEEARALYKLSFRLHEFRNSL
jgi:hypothetical protein